ncbi:TonB-dependent receptor [Brevundimonas sp. BAL450]|uniref:TonB-dependent receptor family protein n=1 Tax=Brevundimonas TaxID=41275 RepID=UPI0018C9B80D|nr:MULTISPECIES: TonB-dependent receptor [Brevundimonas]MBG7613681.1 TonB-dependent receptor [Brevundimonas sp. BAL450]
MTFKTFAAPRALLIALPLAGATACPALAADDQPTTVDSVIVTARPNPDDPPVVAEARARLSRTPGAVSVVAAETYEDRFAQGFYDTLRNVPGVLAQKRYGEESRLSIRGSGIAQGFHQRGVLFAQDGVPFADADGFSDFQAIDAMSARYIEVYKGANTLRFGGAQLGGAVNLVTPTGVTANFDNQLRLEGGSYDSLRAWGAVAREWGDRDLFAAVSGMQSDGYRDHSEQQQARITLNAGRSFGEDRAVRLIFQAADIRQDIPGALTLDQALTAPEMANPGAVALDQARDLDVKRLTLQTRWRLNDATVFEGAVWGWQKDLWHPIFQVLQSDSHTTGLFGRFDWTGQLGGLRADLFYGLSYRDGQVDTQRYVNTGGLPGALTADGVQDASGLDVFAEGRLFVTDNLALVGGGSFGRATRDYRDQRNPANDDSITYDWVSPRLGLLWESADGAQVYANITRSVEPPTYGALVQAPLTGFTPVDLQDAWTAELGTRGRRGALSWDVTVYRSQIDGELLNYIVGPDIPAATFNGDRTVHQGLEAGLEWTLPVALAGGVPVLRQTYNYNDFYFDRDLLWEGNRLPVVPEHQYRAELGWRHTSGLFLTPTVEWRIDDVWVDYANTLKAPSFAVWGLNAGFDFANGVTVFVDARNLTDERYISEFSAVTDARTAAATVFMPGEGRSAFVGVSARF